MTTPITIAIIYLVLGYFTYLEELSKSLLYPDRNDYERSIGAGLLWPAAWLRGIIRKIIS
jgi:hypothetical protein